MSTARNGKNNQSQKSTTVPPPLDQLKVYSNQDILICGNCRELFSELQDLLEHKKTYCKLRFTCKCDTNKSKSQLDDQTTASLLCVQCKDGFQNAWDLMVHAQAAHMLNIYELGVPNNGRCASPSSPRDNNSPDKGKAEPSMPTEQTRTQLSNHLKGNSNTAIARFSYQQQEQNSHDPEDNQKHTSMDTEEENGDVDHDFMENGRDGLTGTPDSATSRNDKELEELMASAARVMEGGGRGGANGSIMHALSIVSTATPAAQPGASPPPLAAATAPMVVAQVASTSTTAVAAELVAPKTY